MRPDLQKDDDQQEVDGGPQAGVRVVTARDGDRTRHFACDGTGLICDVCGESETCCRCEEPEFSECIGCVDGELEWHDGRWVFPLAKPAEGEATAEGA